MGQLMIMAIGVVALEWPGSGQAQPREIAGILIPTFSLTMNLPREGHPENSSFVMLQWRKDIIDEGIAGGCDVHTRHLEPCQLGGMMRILTGERQYPVRV